MSNSIADNLQRLVDARTNIATAITEKGGTVNDGDGFEDFPADIATIPDSSSVDASKPVRYFDYDGTIVASYTAEEFLNLTDEPQLPSHDNMSIDGWNWSFSDAKSYVAQYRQLDIGLVCTPVDQTCLYVTVQEGRLGQRLEFTMPSSFRESVRVDWGDGNSNTYNYTSSTNVYPSHTYAEAGDYCIKIKPSGYKYSIKGQSVSSISETIKYESVLVSNSGPENFFSTKRKTSVKQIEMCDSSTYAPTLYAGAFSGCIALTQINLSSNSTPASSTDFDYIFARCYSLQKIIIPASITNIGKYAFYNCYSLSMISIPTTVTSIGQYAFYGCANLTRISIPNQVTAIDNSTFYNCEKLSQVCISSAVTSIGPHAFYGCHSLSMISIPSTVTSIGQYAFYDCDDLSQITLPPYLTDINAYTFCGCVSLSQITIPSSVTSIGMSAFQNCVNLSQIDIPIGVTSIEQYAFYSCASLTRIIIPSRVTSIGNSAFYNCYSLGYIKFTSSTPPTVANSNAWTAIPSDCKILVPRASLSTYKRATNYPSSSTYTYEGY